ncbi:MAG: hypothetical protein EB117_09160 [Betaproteobacteria bacterium]|nr:hypothetical protein [Betaproteobacteria bacterium]
MASIHGRKLIQYSLTALARQLLRVLNILDAEICIMFIIRGLMRLKARRLFVRLKNQAAAISQKIRQMRWFLRLIVYYFMQMAEG